MKEMLIIAWKEKQVVQQYVMYSPTYIVLLSLRSEMVRKMYYIVQLKVKLLRVCNVLHIFQHSSQAYVWGMQCAG